VVPGLRPACFVENDPYAVTVLKKQMDAGLIEPAPIWDDLRSFDGRPWRGKVAFLILRAHLEVDG
jgi:DNA (cytosine-5)-methyltransferase 1